jgi:hypothetical protein
MSQWKGLLQKEVVYIDDVDKVLKDSTFLDDLPNISVSDLIMLESLVSSVLIGVEDDSVLDNMLELIRTEISYRSIR